MNHKRLIKSFVSLDYYMNTTYMDDNDKQRIIDELTAVKARLLKYRQDKGKA